MTPSLLTTRRRAIGQALGGLCLALGLVACADGGDGVRTQGDILDQDRLLQQIQLLYRRHGMERGGCTPQIFNPIRTEIIEENLQRIILEIDYTYSTTSQTGACSFGRNTRRFQVEKTSRGLAVVGMSGQQMG